MTNSTRGATARPRASVLTTAVILLAGGAAYGVATQRWTEERDSEQLVSRSLPEHVENWRGSNVPVRSRSLLTDCECRRYRNTLTQREVLVYLVGSDPARLATHSFADVFPGETARQIGKGTPVSVRTRSGRTYSVLAGHYYDTAQLTRAPFTVLTAALSSGKLGLPSDTAPTESDRTYRLYVSQPWDSPQPTSPDDLDDFLLLAADELVDHVEGIKEDVARESRP